MSASFETDMQTARALYRDLVCTVQTQSAVAAGLLEKTKTSVASLARAMDAMLDVVEMADTPADVVAIARIRNLEKLVKQALGTQNSLKRLVGKLKSVTEANHAHRNALETDHTMWRESFAASLIDHTTANGLGY